VLFIPPTQKLASSFAPLDKLVVIRDEPIKAKNDQVYRYAEIGDIDVTTGGVSFRSMQGYQLPSKRVARTQAGDVLISTVRTYRKGIGLVTDRGPNLVTSLAVLNICDVTREVPGLTLPYLYAFLRSDFFVEQVWSLLHRGVYPRMDTGALGRIQIPISTEPVCRYVAGLALAIADKEQATRERNRDIDRAIRNELEKNQRSGDFRYEYPTREQLAKQGRFDAAVYSEAFRREEFKIKNYKHGWANYKQLGFSIGRGQNLQVSCIGHSIYSDSMRSNFYRLIAPTDISEFRTVQAFRYLGNKRHLELVKRGDVIFGAEGFCKGRCVILVDEQHKTISNIHGVVFQPIDGSMTKGIFLGCFLGYLRDVGIVDAIGAGGSGGSLAIGYLEQVPFPRFPNEVQNKIAGLYHRDGTLPQSDVNLENFVDWHRKWNEGLGIWELDRELKRLQATLADVQQKIITGRHVQLPF